MSLAGLRDVLAHAATPGKATRQDVTPDVTHVGKQTRVQTEYAAAPEPAWEEIPREEIFQADAEAASPMWEDIPEHEHEPDHERGPGHQPEQLERGHEDPPPEPRQPTTPKGKRLMIADPFILVDGAVWYAYGTGLVVKSSTDQGKTWRSRGHMTNFDKGGRRWAPEVHKIGGNYVAYMSLGATKTSRIAIYVASSSHPVHGWSKPKRIATSKKWSNIDPTFFHDDKTDQNYLIYKQDRATSQGRKRIVMTRLDQSGTHVAKHADTHTMLTAGVGKHSQWERRPAPRQAKWSVEAPTLEFHENKYWLFYSGAGYEPGGGYAVGAAWAHKPTGPFHRLAEPIVRGTGTMREPGHQSVVKVVIGGVTKWLLFFHARGSEGKARYLREDQLVWIDGKPHVKH